MSEKHTPPPMRGTWTLIAPNGRKWEGDSPLRLAAAEQRERVPDQVAVQRVLDAASALRDDDRPKSLHELQDELYEFVTDDSESNGYWLHCEIVSKQIRLFDTLETLVDALTSGAGRDFIEAFVRDASAALEEAQPGWNKVDEPTSYEMRAKGRLRDAAPELLEALKWREQFDLRPGEGYSECFDRIAEVFHRETGYMRPGKDASMACGQTDEERQDAWDKWMADGRARVRAAISKAERRTV